MTRVLKVGLALLLAGSTWYYFDFILVPHQQAAAAARGWPHGNASDLYPRWLGTRELLLHHRDPYSPELTREMQAGFWGRPLDPAQPSDPRDETRFAYPLYVVFLLLPAAFLPFDIVRMIFICILFVLIIAAVPLWLRVLGSRAGAATAAVVSLLAVGSVPVVYGLHVQQLALVVFVLITASAAALVRGRLAIAGILLGVSTIKPQLAAPVAAWFVLWAASDWRLRAKLVWSFAITMILLLAGSEMLLPGWFGRWCDGLGPYVQYNQARSLLTMLLGKYGSAIGTAGIIAVVTTTCWRLRRERVGSRGFGLALSLVLTATLLITPAWKMYDQIMLVPGAVWLCSSWERLGSINSPLRRFSFVAAFLASWGWISALALSIVALAISPAIAERACILPLYGGFWGPVALFLLLGVFAAEVQMGKAFRLGAYSFEQGEG